jgi:tetratricopeptide (TPR) repeat protein
MVRMPHSFCSRLLPVIFCLALLPALKASAQLDAPTPLQEVDPDTAPADDSANDDSVYEDDEPRNAKKKKGKGKAVQEDEDTGPPAAARPGKTPAPVAPPPVAPPTVTPSAAPTAAPTPAPTPAAPPKPEVATRQPPPPLLTPRVSDADLLAVWDRWKEARKKGDSEATSQARKDLLKLRDEVSATDFDAFSVSLVRESKARIAAKDLAGAVKLAEDAAELSPNLSYARFALADAYASKDLGSVSRYMGEIQSGLSALVSDPRFWRPALGNLGAMALLAVLATAAAVVAVLFGRRVRYALHDFHHVFPRGLGRWQSVAVAAAIFLMPVLLRLGVVPVLLVMFGSIVLYLSIAERAVAAVLLALAGLIPLAAGQLAQSTVFAGTVAEDVYVLERGGFTADDAAARVLARQASKEASFEELFALGRYQTRRGQLEEALTAYKAASMLRQHNALLLTNYGNALLASGDSDAATRLYQEAQQVDGSLAAAPYNLAQVYRRQARLLDDAHLSAALQRAKDTLDAAQRLDASLVARDVPPDDRLLANLLLLSPELPWTDIVAKADGKAVGSRVETQLAGVLLGTTGMAAMIYPALLALVFFGLGYGRDRVRASKSCEKCGRPVCRRCDPDLGVGAFMCSQCTNVFARKGVVPEAMRARKQAEVQRHQTWMGRLALGLGAVVSGAGHVFSGLPIRGAIYSFLFLMALSAFVLRDGVLRAPYGEAPLYLKLVPALLLLLPLYLLTLRGLRKRQSE